MGCFKFPFWVLELHSMYIGLLLLANFAYLTGGAVHFVCFFFINKPIKVFNHAGWSFPMCFVILFLLGKKASLSVPSGILGADLFQELINVD